MQRPRETAELIERHIQTLKLKPGEKTPTEAELVKATGVTRHQVRRGLAWLKDNKGWVQLQGSGTYLPGGQDTPRPRDKVIVAVGPFPWHQLSQFDEAQMATMEKGCYLSVVNIESNPKTERQYLTSILERHFIAMLVEPNPIPPLNFDLFDQIIDGGVKVLLMNAPPERRPDYAVFMLDHQKAGYVGCAHLMSRGVKKIIHVKCHTDKDDFAWQYHDVSAGVEEASATLGVEVQTIRAPSVFNESIQELDWRPANPAIPYENKLGYLCENPAAGILIHKKLQALGVRGSHIFAVSPTQRELPFPYAFLDQTERVRRMLAYAFDSRNHPRKKILDLVPPVVIQ